MQTTEMQYDFNFPYQLGSNTRARPHDAQLYRVPVERGDLIVMGSDGLFDNVFPQEILHIIESTEDETVATGGSHAAQADSNMTEHRLRLIRDLLLDRAMEVARDPEAHTPFLERAIEQGFEHRHCGGGKMDDVSVVVAQVADLEDSPDRR